MMMFSAVSSDPRRPRQKRDFNVMNVIVPIIALLGFLALVAMVLLLFSAFANSFALAETVPTDRPVPTATPVATIGTTESFVAENVAGSTADAATEDLTAEATVAKENALDCVCEGEPFIMVTTDKVRERLEPNTDCKVTWHYKKGAEVEVVAIVDGWAKLTNGHYIMAKFLELPNNEPVWTAEEQAAINAHSYLTLVRKWEQKAYLVIRGEVYASAPCTTAKHNSKTPTGLFTVNKWRDDFYMDADHTLHCDHAAFLIDSNGNYLQIALHDAEWEPESGFGSQSYRKKSGSAGCIRCPLWFINILRSNIKAGSYVLIVE